MKTNPAHCLVLAIVTLAGLPYMFPAELASITNDEDDAVGHRGVHPVGKRGSVVVIQPADERFEKGDSVRVLRRTDGGVRVMQ
jgi:hypothetical protein